MVLVKDGFCWPATFLSFMWAGWHRMWVPALVIAVVFGVSGFVMAELRLGYDVSFVSHGFLGLAVGFWGNALRRWHLGRRGYRVVAGVTGANVGEAEERYFREAGMPSELTDTKA